MVGGLRGARNDGILEIIGRPWECREVKGLENVKKITWEYVSLLPKVTEQLIKYLKNKFVSPFFVNGNYVWCCKLLFFYSLFPCNLWFCNYKKKFFPQSNMLTRSKLIKPAPVQGNENDMSLTRRLLSRLCNLHWLCQFVFWFLFLPAITLFSPNSV